VNVYLPAFTDLEGHEFITPIYHHHYSVSELRSTLRSVAGRAIVHSYISMCHCLHQDQHRDSSRTSDDEAAVRLHRQFDFYTLWLMSIVAEIEGAGPSQILLFSGQCSSSCTSGPSLPRPKQPIPRSIAPPSSRFETYYQPLTAAVREDDRNPRQFLAYVEVLNSGLPQYKKMTILRQLSFPVSMISQW
jgi:hypothetical protein